MKHILLILCFFASALISNAQPINDYCSNAIDFGSLPIPGTCNGTIQNGAIVTFSNLTQTGATPENPYTYIPNCSGSTTQPNIPSNDVWYKFVATGNVLNISITNFPNAVLSVYSGTACGNWIGNGCQTINATGTGTLHLTQIRAGQTYWLQVSGFTSSSTSSNFSLSLDNDIDCGDCLLQSVLSLTPSPINGAYDAGQKVDFCYHIEKFQQKNTNWLHGVQLVFGNGWNQSTLITMPPPVFQATTGFWTYTNSCTSSNTGATFGQGFYFETSTVTINPGNNFGDGITASNTAILTTGPNDWNFCWSIKVDSSNVLLNDLSLVVKTSGDGESGSWNDIGCSDDDSLLINVIKNNPTTTSNIKKSEESHVNIYPIPANHIINVALNEEIKWIKIYDVVGNLISEKIQLALSTQASLDVSKLSNGLYLLNIETNSNKTVIKKFTVFR